MTEHLEEQLVNELRAVLKPINEKYKEFFHVQFLTLCDLKDMSCEECVKSETKCKCKRAVFGWEKHG